MLEAQHEHLQALLDDLRHLPEMHEASTTGELDERSRALRRFERAFTRHGTKAEQHFWGPVRRRLPGGGELARAALSHKQHAERALLKMRFTVDLDPRHNSLLGDVLRESEQMLDLERLAERQLAKELTGEERTRLTRELNAKGGLIPTRAHPDAPTGTRAAHLFGPLFGALDRVKDLYDRWGAVGPG